MVGNTVRKTIDANPSLCLSDPMNVTNDVELMVDYSNCPASVDIAITMTFVYAMFMVGLLTYPITYIATYIRSYIISITCIQFIW